MRKRDRCSWRTLEVERVDDEPHDAEHTDHDEQAYQSPDDVAFAFGKLVCLPASLVHNELCNTPDEHEYGDSHHEKNDRIYNERIDLGDERIDARRVCRSGNRRRFR